MKLPTNNPSTSAPPGDEVQFLNFRRIYMDPSFVHQTDMSATCLITFNKDNSINIQVLDDEKEE